MLNFFFHARETCYREFIDSHSSKRFCGGVMKNRYRLDIYIYIYISVEVQVYNSCLATTLFSGLQNQFRSLAAEKNVNVAAILRHSGNFYRNATLGSERKRLHHYFALCRIITYLQLYGNRNIFDKKFFVPFILHAIFISFAVRIREKKTYRRRENKAHANFV